MLVGVVVVAEAEICTLQLNERETTTGPDAAVVCSMSAYALRPLPAFTYT